MSSMLLAAAAAMPCPAEMPFSPLVLSDQLITLAQHADRAGYSESASRLLHLAYIVLDDAQCPVSFSYGA